MIYVKRAERVGRQHLGTRLDRFDGHSGTGSLDALSRSLHGLPDISQAVGWPTDSPRSWSAFVIEGNLHRVDYGADSGWWEEITEFEAHYDALALGNRNLDGKTQVG